MHAWLQVSYGIGLPQPLSVYVDTYKTSKLPDEDIQELLLKHFDFRPGFIITVRTGFRAGARGFVMTVVGVWGLGCMMTLRTGFSARAQCLSLT